MLTTLERLDRESVTRHELTLMVRDRGTPLPRRSYARVVINVVDVNDHVPEFLASQYEGRVYSTSVPGTSVAQLTAMDRDHADNAVVSYSIISGQALHLSFLIFVVVFNPWTPTVAVWTATNHPVPDRVKPLFVIFDIRAL